MNKAILLLSLWISPLFLLAQFDQSDVLSKQLDPIYQYNTNNARSATEFVLDSIVTFQYDEFDQEYKFEQWDWRYNEHAQTTQFNAFRWDDLFEKLYHYSKSDVTYLTDQIIDIRQRTNNAIEPLAPTYKTTRLLDADGNIEERYFETWNDDLQTYESNAKYIYTINTDTLEVNFRYLWEEDLMEYELAGKSETRTQEFFRSTTSYYVDVLGEFIPNYVLNYEYYPENGLRSVFEQINYDAEMEEWNLITRDRTVYNIATLDGYSIRASTFNPISSGEFIVYDSTTFVINENYERSIGQGFVPYANNLDLFLHVFNYEYDNYPNGYIKEIKTEMKEGTGTLFKPSERKYYYRSEIITATESPTLSPTLEITFPNPATQHDIININKLPEGQQAELWICDAAGKILHRSLVTQGDQYSLQALNMASGLNYLTLFVKGGQKTWPVVVH